MKRKLLILCLLVAVNCFAQNVTIPDVNFKTILVTNYDTNGDNEISMSEAASVTGTINATGAAIIDITGVEAFVNITGLNVENNAITTVDLSQNTQLTTIDIDNNAISLIDLSALTSLQFLYADSNQLLYLDFSNNGGLFSVIAKNNAVMTGVNLDNGNSNGIFIVDLTNNSSLSCIQVDAATMSNPPASWSVDAMVSYATECPDFCYVNIPDAAFKNALLTSITNENGVPVNTNGDNEIQCAEAASITGTISLNNLGITDLTGIEAFTSMFRLFLVNDMISGNIDLSQNTSLAHFTANNVSISGVTFGAYLESVTFQNNANLNNVNVSSSASLSSVTINNNETLAALDLSTNESLTFIDISDNPIASLNLSGNYPALNHLLANRTSLSGSLDFSHLTALFNLQLIGNANTNITGLNIANGNNANFLLLNITGNPNLLCVEVDDANLVTNAPWSQEDAQTVYNEDCAAFLCWVNIPDVNFKTELVNNPSINLNGDNEIQCAEAQAYTGSISVGGKNISDMTGIEEFVNVTELICFANQITELDLTANVNLTSLFCNANLLTSLNVANGNNINFTNFNATLNASLSCIQVDNVAYSNANWPNKDAGASYSTDCSTLSVIDRGFGLNNVKLYPNPAHTLLNIDMRDFKQLEVYSILGLKVLTSSTSRINVSNFEDGIYLIRLTNTQGQVVTKRFTIKH